MTTWKEVLDAEKRAKILAPLVKAAEERTPIACLDCGVLYIPDRQRDYKCPVCTLEWKLDTHLESILPDLNDLIRRRK